MDCFWIVLGNAENTAYYYSIMNSFFRLIINIFKGLIFSVVGGLAGFLVTVSLINGNFPPTWKDIMSVKKKIEVVAQFKNNPLWKSKMENQMNEDSGEYRDPELADVREVVQYHKNQAKISQNLTEGEMTFGSKPPPAELKKSPEEVALTERLRKLEDLVFILQNQIKTLNSQMQGMQSK